MKAWRVRLTPGDVGERVESGYYRIDAGALVLWSGSLFEPSLVRAYAPGAWHSIEPAPTEEPT